MREKPHSIDNGTYLSQPPAVRKADVVSQDAQPLTQKQRRSLHWSLVVAVMVVVLSLIYYDRTGNGAALAFTGSFFVGGITSGYRLYRADRRKA